MYSSACRRRESCCDCILYHYAAATLDLAATTTLIRARDVVGELKKAWFGHFLALATHATSTLSLNRHAIQVRKTNSTSPVLSGASCL